jgi:type I restriction enzyme S subunit
MEWPIVELERAAEIRGGATPSRDRLGYWSGDIPWVTPTDLPELGSGIAEVAATANRITAEGLDACSASLLPAGTVLFSSRATIGKVAIAAVPLATNQGFANLIPRPGVDSRYLAWCLLFNAERISRLAGSTTFKEVAKGVLKHFRIPLPAISEQRRIVEILDQADRLRRLRVEADAKADRILIALFIKMFGDPAMNPMGWPVEPLDRLVRIGGSLVNPNEEEYFELPHIGGENIEKDTGRLLNLRSVRESQLRSAKFLFSDRHVLYCKIRPYLNKVAFPRQNGLCSADIYPVLPVDGRIGPWYLLALLRSDGFVQYARGQSDRLRMPKLNRQQLGGFPVPVPPKDRVAAFELAAAQISGLDSIRKRASQCVSSLFRSFLDQAFSAQLTASWREAHMNKLHQEMEQQSKELDGHESR